MLRNFSKTVCVCVGLMCLGVSGSAFGHSGPNLHVPENDFVVKWFQPHGEVPVEYWDLEITPLEGASQTYIREARVFADDSCWGVNVPIDRRAKVRIRGVTNDQVSEWSRHTVVPEPAFALSSGMAVGLLSVLARRRRSAKRQRDVSAL